jgi:hypothetical protein
MRVVGLVVNQKPRKTPGKPQENTSKVPDTKVIPKKTTSK